jgi:4a-hydroxytetrahydrobiopterin dehydratase
MEPMTEEEIESALIDLPEWGLENGELVRSYRFPDFAHAIDFVNVVAERAEAMQHHPGIDVRVNKVTLRISTHDVGGVTLKDFELALRVDR